MIPLRRLQIKEKNTQRIVLIKSFSLFFHEALLFLFWTALLVLSIADESELGMLDFYWKNLPAGLVLIPAKTLLVLLLPALMALFSFFMLSTRTIWKFEKGSEKVSRSTYFLFFLRFLKKEWSFSDIAGLRLVKENRKTPYVLELGRESGKLYFMDQSRGEKKIDEMGRDIAVLTGLKYYK